MSATTLRFSLSEGTKHTMPVGHLATFLAADFRSPAWQTAGQQAQQGQNHFGSSH